jgi:hypothetical protein
VINDLRVTKAFITEDGQPLDEAGTWSAGIFTG